MPDKHTNKRKREREREREREKEGMGVSEMSRIRFIISLCPQYFWRENNPTFSFKILVTRRLKTIQTINAMSNDGKRRIIPSVC